MNANFLPASLLSIAAVCPDDGPLPPQDLMGLLAEEVSCTRLGSQGHTDDTDRVS